jgi:chaperonin cofactor prefoldin
MDKQQNLLKEQRYQGLEDLYKEINVSKDISYVDYDKDIYNENIKNLKEGLNSILTKSDNETLNRRVGDLLDIIDSKQENIIWDASKKVQNLEKQYYSIVSKFQKNNDDLSNLIRNDYDKFLYAVANNDVSLVNDQDINISLSSNLSEKN